MAAETTGRTGPRPAPGYWWAADGRWYPAEQHPDPARRLVLLDEAARAAAPTEPAEPAAGGGVPLASPRGRRALVAGAGSAVVVAIVAAGLMLGLPDDGAHAGDRSALATGRSDAGVPPAPDGARPLPAATSAVTASSAPPATPSRLVPDAAPTPTALPTPGSSRELALPVGRTATLPDAESGDIDVVVDRFSADATAEVLAAQSFNPPPPAGTSYVMVHLVVTYHAGTARRSLDALLLDVDWTVVASGGQEHAAADAGVIPPDALDTFAPMADGASRAGNLVFAVEPGSPLHLRVAEAHCSIGCDQVWFRLG